jgi:hypothetical protein
MKENPFLDGVDNVIRTFKEAIGLAIANEAESAIGDLNTKNPKLAQDMLEKMLKQGLTEFVLSRKECEILTEKHKAILRKCLVTLWSKMEKDVQDALNYLKAGNYPYTIKKIQWIISELRMALGIETTFDKQKKK